MRPGRTDMAVVMTRHSVTWSEQEVYRLKREKREAEVRRKHQEELEDLRRAQDEARKRWRRRIIRAGFATTIVFGLVFFYFVGARLRHFKRP